MSKMAIGTWRFESGACDLPEGSPTKTSKYWIFCFATTSENLIFGLRTDTRTRRSGSGGEFGYPPFRLTDPSGLRRLPTASQSAPLRWQASTFTLVGKKAQNWHSGPRNSSPERAIYPQRVRQRRGTSKYFTFVSKSRNFRRRLSQSMRNYITKKMHPTIWPETYHNKAFLRVEL